MALSGRSCAGSTAAGSLRRDPSFQMAEKSKLEYKQILSEISDIRTLVLNTGLQTPQIVVVGNQSSGKSALLTRLTGIKFPSKSGMCTRAPIMIETRQGTVSEFEKFDDASQRWDQLPSLDALQKHIEVSNEAIKNRQQDRDAVSATPIRVRVTGPTQPDLDLVDTPGLRGARNGDEDIQKLLKSRELIGNPMSVNLIVLEANQYGGATSYAQVLMKEMLDKNKSQANGFDTVVVNVYNKVDDLCNSGEGGQREFLRMMKSSAGHVNGPHGVVSYVPRHRDRTLGTQDTDEQEALVELQRIMREDGFRANADLMASPELSGRFGLKTLSLRLSEKYAHMVLSSILPMQKKIQERIGEVEALLKETELVGRCDARKRIQLCAKALKGPIESMLDDDFENIEKQMNRALTDLLESKLRNDDLCLGYILFNVGSSPWFVPPGDVQNCITEQILEPMLVPVKMAVQDVSNDLGSVFQRAKQSFRSMPSMPKECRDINLDLMNDAWVAFVQDEQVGLKKNLENAYGRWAEKSRAIDFRGMPHLLEAGEGTALGCVMSSSDGSAPWARPDQAPRPSCKRQRTDLGGSPDEAQDPVLDEDFEVFVDILHKFQVAPTEFFQPRKLLGTSNTLKTTEELKELLRDRRDKLAQHGMPYTSLRQRKVQQAANPVVHQASGEELTSNRQAAAVVASGINLDQARAIAIAETRQRVFHAAKFVATAKINAMKTLIQSEAQALKSNVGDWLMNTVEMDPHLNQDCAATLKLKAGKREAVQAELKKMQDAAKRLQSLKGKASRRELLAGLCDVEGIYQRTSGQTV